MGSVARSARRGCSAHPGREVVDGTDEVHGAVEHRGCAQTRRVRHAPRSGSGQRASAGGVPAGRRRAQVVCAQVVCAQVVCARVRAAMAKAWVG
jgi:hypothetical protein